MNSKKHTLSRKLLATLLTAAMLLTMLPATMFAGEPGSGETTSVSTAKDSPIQIKKSIEEDSEGDPQLVIDAWATGEKTVTENVKPVDIVLVLDQSGSMAEGTGEVNYQYTALEKNEWSYNDVVNKKYYYYDESSGNYYRVIANKDGGLFEQKTYWLSYGDENSATQLGEKSSNRWDTIFTGTLYTRQTSETTKLSALQSAVTSFVDTVKSNSPTKGSHNIALVGFASGYSWNGNTYLYDNTGVFVGEQFYKYNGGNRSFDESDEYAAQNHYTEALKSANDSSITKSIEALDANGGTLTNYGIEMANGILKTVDDPDNEREKVIIVFTDGQPGWSGYDNDTAQEAINQANLARQAGTTVYSVGVFGSNHNEEQTDSFMTSLAGDASRYFVAENAEGLTAIFEKIAEEIGSASVEADGTSVLNDVLTENFVIDNDNGRSVTVQKVPYNGNETWGTPEDSGLEATSDGKSISVTGFDYSENYVWDSGDQHGGYALRLTIPIKADTDCTTWGPSGFYDTNKSTSLSYGEDQNATLNDSPNVWVNTYQVTYDSNGGSAVKDERNYISGQTATVKEAPTKTGYTFKGWKLDEDTIYQPDDSISITGNVNLTAQWEKDESQTKKLSYTVEYYKDNEKVDGDTETVEKTVWVNDSNTLAVDKDAINISNKYQGYKFDEKSTGTIPETIDNGGVIKVYYVKDESQTKKLSYTVEYYKDNQKVDGDTETVEKTVWVNDSNTLAVDKDAINISNKYQGYKFDEKSTGTIPETIDNGGVIKVYYVKDAQYTLRYDANGGEGAPTDTNKYAQGDKATLSSDKPTHDNVTYKDKETKVVFLGWSLEKTDKIYAAGENYKEKQFIENNEVTFADKNITVYAVWGYDTNGDNIADATQVMIQPAAMTIYTGGDGYLGTVDDASGTTVGTKESGLPEPGFYFTLPYDMNQAIKSAAGTSENAADLSQYLTINAEANSETGTTAPRSWTIQLYDPDGTSDVNGKYVYSFTPGKGQEKVRMQFTNGEDIIISDKFNVKDALHQEYTMSLYTGSVDAKTVQAVVKINGQADLTATVGLLDSTLTIRGVTGDGQSNGIVGNVNNAVNTVTASTENGTPTYYINGSQIQVTNQDAVKLLVDSIVDSDLGEGQYVHDTLLDMAKDENALPSSYDGVEFKYLDLVDRSNGNVWVTMGKDDSLTVYWPYPAGTDQDDDFTIIHYEGLDREFDLNNLANQKVDIQKITPEKTAQGLKFTVSSFSPFALVYDKQTSGGGGTTGGGTTPNPLDLNTEDHFSYVVGYPEDYRTGEPSDDESLWPVKPQGNITRAEVASIFYRLLKDDVRDANTTDVSEFSDVSASDWYGTTVATLSAMDIVRGYEDGTFRPNAPITRAEFAAIATRFFEETGAEYEPGTFDDVTGNEWFANAIADAVELGLIGGYPDGTVRPNNNITRAEACAIVNRTLGRIPHVDHLLPADEMTTWPDNNPSDWFYADMQEATNGHEYEWTTEQGQKVEEWTEILDKDWEDR